MNFFDSFWKASFYQDGRAVSFWKAFWKIVLVVFLLSVAYAVMFYVTIGKKIPTYIQKYSAQALDGYPSDLVVTIKDGKLSKNIPGTLHLYPLPEDFSKKSNEEALPTYVVTINDKESVSLESYKKADSLVLLANDGMVSRGEKGIEIRPYSDMSQSAKEFTFDKSVIVAVVDKVHEYEPRISWIIVSCMVIFVTLFAPSGFLIATLLYGLVVMWLSMWIMKKKATYTESYIIALYALAPVVLISTLLEYVPYIKNIVNGIPFFTLIAVILFLKYMFMSTRKKEGLVVDPS